MPSSGHHTFVGLLTSARATGGSRRARRSGSFSRDRTRDSRQISRELQVHSVGSLSVRRPRNAGWRSLSPAVHSAYAIWATSFGRTHVAPPIRGGGVNGQRGVRKRASRAPSDASVSRV